MSCFRLIFQSLSLDLFYISVILCFSKVILYFTLTLQHLLGHIKMLAVRFSSYCNDVFPQSHQRSCQKISVTLVYIYLPHKEFFLSTFQSRRELNQIKRMSIKESCVQVIMYLLRHTLHTSET